MSLFTTAQQDAIAARGNVIVVAGAGTGKTSTLVQRCLRLIIDEGCSLEEILMVTFTEAAAAEMRHRIRGELQKALMAPGSDAARAGHLEKQLALLDTARISTLHSFCLELVRQNFHALEIDPQLVVLDETQTEPLIAETLDAVLGEHYGGESPTAQAVRALVQRHGSDRKLRALIVKMHRYTQTLADPAGWIEEQLARLAEPEPRLWREWLAEGFHEWRELWLPELRSYDGVPALGECAKALEEVGPGKDAVLEAIDGALERILAADGEKKLWPRGSRTTVRKELKAFFSEAEFLRTLTGRTGVPPVPDEPTAEQESNGEDQDRRDAGPTEALAEDWGWVREPMSVLLELAREFTARFSEAKRQLGGIDFADQEQFALRLLWDRAAQRPTALAEGWRRQFRYVFVDEYQDINAAQDAIIRAISGEGASANRFLVGDVKQSIYRFRLADPRIFREREEAWRGAADVGRRIPLADNFRSREAVLVFVNALFSALMRPAVGGVAYDEDARLQFGNREGRALLALGGATFLSPQDPGCGDKNVAAPAEPRVEFHLLANGGEENAEGGAGEETSEAEAELFDLEATEKEARLVALRLRQLKEQGHEIWDDKAGHMRAVEWRDMVVLLRSLSSRAESYAQEFHRMGVPLLAPREGFYAAQEIMDLLCLLRLLDNPLQDVPLLAVLRSPLVGLSLEELAEIRMAAKGQLFWTALCRKAEGPPLTPSLSPSEGERVPEGRVRGGPTLIRDKISHFLAQFARWRQLAREGSLSQCLDAVLADTHYEALLQTETRGTEREANVHRLLDLVRQYDPYQRQGLFRFLRFVDSQQEAELDQEPAPVQTTDAVRLMTIHKSKGLEFPVVVVAGLGTKFNEQNLNEEILLNERYGLCPKVTPPETDQRYPSLPYWLARRRERRELLGEELRLLYVATTRARDTLVLVGATRCKDVREVWAAVPPAPLRDQEVLSARSFLDWLRLWMTRNELGGATFLSPQPPVCGDKDAAAPPGRLASLLRWTIYSATDPRLLKPAEEVAQASSPACGNRDDGQTVATETAAPTAEAIRALQEKVAWKYAFSAATVEPAKSSVTALRRRAAEETDEDARPLFQFKVPSSKFKVGGGTSRTKLSAAERGTAHHTFMEFVNLENTGSAIGLRNEAERLRTSGVLSAEQAGCLDFESLSAFWHSELGGRIRAQSACVHREIPFTARCTAPELAAAGIPLGALQDAPALTGEFVVVQGFVDLAVILPEEILLLDFKTDHLDAAELGEKVKLYEPQLRLYALALERIFQRPVRERWLHFFALGRSVAMG